MQCDHQFNLWCLQSNQWYHLLEMDRYLIFLLSRMGCHHRFNLGCLQCDQGYNLIDADRYLLFLPSNMQCHHQFNIRCIQGNQLYPQLHTNMFLIILLFHLQYRHPVNPPHLQCKTVVYRVRPWQVLKMWRLLLELLLWVKVLVITLFQTDVSF